MKTTKKATINSNDSVTISSICSDVLAITSDVLEFRRVTEATTGGVLSEKMFLEISQNSQENTCARVSIPINLQA